MKQCLTLICPILLTALAAPAQNVQSTTACKVNDSLTPSLALIRHPFATPLPAVSPDFYSRNLGFFCKKEIQVEQKTKLPLRIRLGSLQYTDWLESKAKTPAPFR